MNNVYVAKCSDFCLQPTLLKKWVTNSIISLLFLFLHIYILKKKRKEKLTHDYHIIPAPYTLSQNQHIVH